MKKYVGRLFPFLLFVILFTNCRKKAFDEFYGRPENLAPPIYQQLQAKGNFKNLLTCIDKAGYTATLSAAGYWTFFAPNDSAFQNFFTQRGITDISQLDSGTCKQIVTYCLVYNAFAKAKIGDYQSNTGWVPNTAFRRRTINYQGFYKDVTNTGQNVTALSANRNGGFVLGDNNNKYIPYFVDNFLSANRLAASDYNYFFPNTTYTGFNVVDASVVTADIVAENGYIHEINKVLLPLPNIEQYLASNPQYSEFKKLYDKYMVQFLLSSDATTRYKLLGGSGDVFIKQYNAGLGFALNNENFLKTQDNDAQAGSWTLFAPKNDVLTTYIKNVLLENYTSLDQLPIQIVIDFLNAHMWQAAVWPSKFGNTNNVQAEPARFDPKTDIIDRQMLSNGIFYGTSKVQQANVFSTIYSRPYLDPKYLLMTRMLDQSLRYSITVPTLKYNMIMMSDDVLRSFGYDYNGLQSQWQYTAPGTSSTTVSPTINSNLQRILALHIVPAQSGEMDDISGSGIVETINGEYIKYNAGRFISAGSQDSGYVVNSTGSKGASNGKVYYANRILTYTNKKIAQSLIALAPTATSDYYNFVTMVRNSPLYNASTNDILGVSLGVFYTIFAPNNAAVVAAANAGLLPKKPTGLPNIDNNPAWTPTERDQVNNFILYHFLNKNTVVPDGKKTGTFESLLKKISGDPTTFSIASAPGSMVITDNYGRKANVVVASSNNLADRCVIHLIDNYLQYNPQ